MAQTTVPPAVNEPAKPTKPSGYFIGALVDALAPLVTYFVFHALGVTPKIALVLGIVVALATTAMHTIKRKKLDGFGLLVLAEIGAGLLLQFLTHDTRLLMVKPSFYSGIGAVYLAYTAFGDHPLSYEGSRPMATKEDPVRLAAYEEVWKQSRAFRTLHRVATLGWAVAFLADAVLRAVIIYAFPMPRAIWMSNVPHLAAIVLLVVFSAMVGKKAKPLVEAQLQQMPSLQNATA